METEVVLAVVASITAIATAYITARYAKQNNAESEPEDFKKQVLAAIESGHKEISELYHHIEDMRQCDDLCSKIDVGAVFRKTASIYDQVISIIRSSEIDRVLVLKACNGEAPPDKITAILQMRAHGQDVIPYEHLKPDYAYIDMLYRIEKDGGIILVVKEMPDCMLKRIYQEEGVVSSFVSHIKTIKNGDQKVIYFASYASHEPVTITDTAKTRCHIITGQLATVLTLIK